MKFSYYDLLHIIDNILEFSQINEKGKCVGNAVRGLFQHKANASFYSSLHA